jgi:hypothetical protein
MANVPEFQKPTFDARIQYYELLRAILHEGKKAAVMSDLMGWYRCLHITYNMVCPYIEPAENTLLREQLFVARNKILQLYHPRVGSHNMKLQNEMKIDKMLMELDENIHKAARRMMLPLEQTSTGEFDMERFMRESDLAG